MLNETAIKTIAIRSLAHMTKARKETTDENLAWAYQQLIIFMEAIETHGTNFRSSPSFVLAFMDLVSDGEKLSSADPYADKRDFIHETAGKTPQKVRYV